MQTAIWEELAMGFSGSICLIPLSKEGFNVLLALAPKLMLSPPHNFMCFSNSSNFFNFYTSFLIACQVKTLDLISECAFSSYMHITFLGFFH